MHFLTSALRTLQAHHPVPCLLCQQPANADLQSFLCTHCIDLWFNHPKISCPVCALTLNIQHPWYREALTECTDCKDADFKFTSTVALFDYFPPATQLIAQIKQGHIRLLKALADYLSQRLTDKFLLQLAPSTTCHISYVPMQPHKLYQRGFNQSQLLAQYVGQALGLTCTPLFQVDGAWQKDMHARQVAQKKLGRSQRLQAQSHKFCINPKAFHHLFATAERQQQQTLHIILIDDVLTTGATLNELAMCLLKAHALIASPNKPMLEISTAVLARTLHN